MIQVIDSIPWVRCASGNVFCYLHIYYLQGPEPGSSGWALINRWDGTVLMGTLLTPSFAPMALSSEGTDCSTKRLSNGDEDLLLGFHHLRQYCPPHSATRGPLWWKTVTIRVPTGAFSGEDPWLKRVPKQAFRCLNVFVYLSIYLYITIIVYSSAARSHSFAWYFRSRLFSLWANRMPG